MPTFLAWLRVLGCAAAGGLALLGGASHAQQGGVFAYRWNSAPPPEAITPADVREALIWTGHLDAVFRGELNVAVRKAAQAWQKSKGLAPTETLSDEQRVELVPQALKERDDVGWSVLRDTAVGFIVGVPAKLLTFGTPRNEGSALWYYGTGAVSQIGRRAYGLSGLQEHGHALRDGRRKARYRLRQEYGFVALFRHGDRNSYLSWTCNPAGSISTEMTVPVDMLETHRGLFAAMASSLRILRTPDPTVRPRPGSRSCRSHPRLSRTRKSPARKPKARAKASAPSAIDEAGKTEALKLETRDGPDLRAEEVFETAAGAVYKVKADKRFGSAVAISEGELLTNCHVVGDLAEVTIGRAKEEFAAKVVSRNADADRCVLRTTAKLPKWVTVRPYDDIKVGERAFTIGAPQGLELTVAEGIVSSKRSRSQTRLIQTSAPISPGSSGGGLFDARGHLLGITTFHLRVGQNLNFAVAAEEFALEPDEAAAR